MDVLDRGRSFHSVMRHLRDETDTGLPKKPIAPAAAWERAVKITARSSVRSLNRFGRIDHGTRAILTRMKPVLFSCWAASTSLVTRRNLPTPVTILPACTASNFPSSIA